MISQKDRLESPPARIQDLCQLIGRASKYRQAIVAVDALDECNQGREELLNFFRDLGANKSISVFVTSRNEQDIRETFQNFQSLPLSEFKNQTAIDIEAYINDELRMRSRLKRLSPELKNDIKDTLLQGADGM